MIEVQGKYNNAKIFTDVVDSTSIAQVLELCNQEFTAGSRIRMMPDIHAGAGCTIGTTMTITDKVVPNLVGVDIGCLDKDTEVLTPDGWIRISDYSNEKILTYDIEHDTANFDMPIAYIKNPCSEFYYLHHSKGLDQMISEEHKMVIWRGYKSRGYKKSIKNAKTIIDEHNLSPKSNRYIKTTFHTNEPGLPLTDDMIRLLVMISADGCIKHIGESQQLIELHFRKTRKINRAKDLLNANKIKFNEYTALDGTTYIDFHTNKTITKSLQQFFKASYHQLKVLTDEIYHWDGTIDHKHNHKSFSSSNKINTDVIQYALHATGTRAGIYIITFPDYPNWNTMYQTYETKNEYVGFPTETIQKVPSVDGWKYCFTTKTGFFIIRRNNNISITGNCGMETVCISEKSVNLQKLDQIIHEKIPSGFAIRDKAHDYLNKINLNDLCCISHVKMSRAEKSIGTLGGGNHFIEMDKDDDGNLYLVIHSGSRHLGVEVANYYQEEGYKALNHADDAAIRELVSRLKAEGREKQIEKEIKRVKNLKQTNIPKSLAFVSGELFEQYIHDMKIVQHYAMLNRQAMVDEIVRAMGFHVEEQFTTIHNYIDTEAMILRKGAVSAKAGEKLLIPINMRDGSLICVGKGNEDWNLSAPHGAGRLMSRAEAKRSFTVSEFEEQMTEVYTTSVNKSTLDECPMAYKNMQDILNNIGPTAEVVKIIRPIYNFKAGED